MFPGEQPGLPAHRASEGCMSSLWSLLGSLLWVGSPDRHPVCAPQFDTTSEDQSMCTGSVQRHPTVINTFGGSRTECYCCLINF